MKFILFTPHRQFDPLECDSVRLSIAEGSDGKFSGSYGIRRGHADAIFSLSEGRISVSLGEKEIFSGECPGGFATVEKDVVRVTADSFSEI